MKLVVEPIYTYACGDYLEMQHLESLLVAPDADDTPHSLLENNRFYTGLLNRVKELLGSQSIEFEIEWTYDNQQLDPSEILIPEGVLPGIELRPHQIAALVKLLAWGCRGVVQIATGGGKTEIACALSKILNVPTLFVNDRVKHASQALRRFNKYGIDCGMVGGGIRDSDHLVVSAVADSLYTGLGNGDEEILDILNRTQLLIMDECHHLTSNSWNTIADNCPAPFRVGLSASAFERPDDKRLYEDMILIGQTGDVVCNVPPRWLIDRGWMAEPLVHFIPINTVPPETFVWNEVYSEGVVDNRYRNYVTAGLARELSAHGHKVLVLVQRLNHGRSLLKLWQDPQIIFSFGGEATYRFEDNEIKEGRMDQDAIESHFDEMKSGILMGSTVFDESLDLDSVTALILAGGGKKYRRILQRVGRAAHSKQDYVHVFDYWDRQHKWLTKHSRERLIIYNNLQYKAYDGLAEFAYRTGIELSPAEIVHKILSSSALTT